MKRLLVLVIMSVAVISACSSSDKTTTCKMNLGDDEVIEVSITVTSEDDKVSKIVTENIVDLKKSADYTSADELEEFGKELTEAYKTVDGVTYSYEVSKTEFKDTLEVEVTDKNFDSLKTSGLLSGYVEGEDKKVSLKTVKAYLEDREMECK